MPVDHWNRVQSLFLAAADLPAEEQRRLLDRECGGDIALVGEVESLLSSDRKQGARIAAAVEEEAVLVFDAEALVGNRLGDYRIIEEVGSGGMGTVYRAVRDDDQYHKQVAIKVVKRGMDTHEVLRRSRYERQILANLDHPYIARLLDAGVSPDGRPFLVMDWVAGEPLDKFVNERKLDVKARLRLFIRVLEAVAYAHRNLVLHLDLKPANILITPEGSPRLLDFGVAKLLSPDAEAGPTVTSVARPFTPEYASPEQVRCDAVSTATDVYALGAILYELLTSKRAQTIERPTPVQIQQVVCEAEVRRPSTLARGLDPDLDNIVLMAMRKEPDRRYRSVDQMAEDIRRHLDGRTVLARADSTAYRLRKFVRRNRYNIAAAILVTVGLIFGLVFTIIQSRQANALKNIAEVERSRALARSREAEVARAAEAEQRGVAGRERDVAVQQRALAEQQRALAEQRVDQMLNLLNTTLWEHYDVISKLPGAMEARRQLINNSLEFLRRLEKEIGLDDRMRYALSAAYLKIGDLQGSPERPSLGEYDHAKESYLKAEALAAPLYRHNPNQPEMIGEWLQIELSIADMAPTPEKTLEGYLKLEPIAKHLTQLAPTDPHVMEEEINVEGLISSAMRKSNPAGALEHGNRAIAILTELVRRFPKDDTWKMRLGIGLAGQGGSYQLLGQLDRAADYFERSIKLREPLLESSPHNVELQHGILRLYGNYAALLGIPIAPNLGRYAEATQYCEKSVALARKLAAADPDSATGRLDLALSLSRSGMVGPDVSVYGLAPGDFELQWKHLEEALAIFEPLVKANPKSLKIVPFAGQAREFAGYRLESLGKAAEAEAQFRQGLAEAEVINAAASGTMMNQASIDEQALAMLFARQGDRTRALEFANKAVARIEADAHKGYLVRALVTMASVRKMFGDVDEARESARRAITVADSIHDPGVIALQKPRLEQADAILREAATRK